MADRLLARSVAVTSLACVLSLASSAAGAQAVRPIGGGDVQGVEASSEGPEGEASRVVDGRVGSAWIGRSGAGAGEEIVLRFVSTRYLTRIDVQPGHGRDNVAFKAWARPARIRVAWDGGEATFELEDRRKMQSFELPALARTTRLSIRIEAAVGPLSAGVAIAELVAYEPSDVMDVDPTIRERIEADVTSLGASLGEVPGGGASGRPGGAGALERVVSHGPPALPWLVSRARTGAPGSAAIALEAIRRIDPARSRDLMAEVLRSTDLERAGAVLRVLAGAEPAGLADPLHAFATRKDLDGDLAVAALDALARTSDRRALPLLEAALVSGDPAAMAVAATRLELFEEAGLEVVTRHVDDAPVVVRLAAVAALGGFDGSSAAVAAARASLRSSSEAVRLAALDALGRLGGEEARESLRAAVESERGEVRDRAMGALAAQGADALPILRQLLESADGEFQGRVFDHLGRLRDEGVLGMLVEEVLDEEHPPWQRFAVRALAAHGNAGVVALFARLGEEPRKAEVAAAFLERVASQAAPAATRLLDELPVDRDRDDLRIVLLETIRHATSLESAPTVVSLFRDETAAARVRAAALETLGFLRTDEVKDVVIEALGSPDPRIALLAVRAAGRLRDARAVPAILADLEARESHTWPGDSIEALGALGAREALPLFRREIDRVGRPLKLSILRACSLIGGKDAVGVLVDATISADVVVSRAAHGLLSGSR